MIVATLLGTMGATLCPAETGYEGWLRYADLDRAAQTRYNSLPAIVVRRGNSPVTESAQRELVRGVRGVLGRVLREEHDVSREPSIVLATFAELREMAPDLKPPPDLRDDGFWIVLRRVRGVECLVVAGTNERGVLYGTFALLSRMARGESVASLNIVQPPYTPIRC